MLSGPRLSVQNSPDAGATIARHHGQADGELEDAQQLLEADIPAWSIGCQDPGDLQDGHRHPQHPGQEGNQDQPEVQRPRRSPPTPSSVMKPMSTARKVISTAWFPVGSLRAWS